jgi:photosystem II stability/assembly factor-like uncharacterized protein
MIGVRTQGTIFCGLWLLLMAPSAIAQISERRGPGQSIADGELQDCQMITLDRLIAVGDRGLILMSENGGRSWNTRNPRSQHELNGVNFTSELDGCVVGGFIEPLTHRSKGVVLLTNDGGRTWRASKSDLPRLVGIQAIDALRRVAWGDWSNTHQTAFFGSVDGGETWQPIPTPCGSIATAALATNPHVVEGILVDRWSSSGGAEPLVLPRATSDEPIRHVCYSGSRWWLCGERGQIYSSNDGKQWVEHKLPGTDQDRALISLRRVIAQGKSIWVAGSPGRVLWHSSDEGRTWSIHQTGIDADANGLRLFQDELLIACGPYTTVNLSRNRGQGWRVSHGASSRVSVLNIATRADHIAWDLLSVVSKDARQNSSGVVVHDRNLEERSSHRPEQSTRTRLASKEVDISQLTTLSMYPISDSEGEPRKSDLRYYAGVSSMHQIPTSEILRRLILEIRTKKPSLLVVDSDQTSDELQQRLSQCADMAVTWASRRDYALFSKESGIPDDAWNVERTLYRGDRGNGRQFPLPMLLKNTGTILGEVLAPVHGIAYSQGISQMKESSRFSYRSVGSQQTNLLNPLEGLTSLSGTQMVERSFGSTRSGQVMLAAAWMNRLQDNSHQTANPMVRDTEWETKLQQAAKMIDPTPRAVVLLDLAIQARRTGKWNLWSSSLEILLDKEKDTPYAEAAMYELMKHLGSAEVQRMLESQRHSEESRPKDSQQVTHSVALQTSPFARDAEASMVKPASFAHTPRLIPIATHGGMPEFYRLLSKFPDTWRDNRSEPEWAWLIASRFRTHQLSKLTSDKLTPPEALKLQSDSASLFPVGSPNLLAWQYVQMQELEMVQQRGSSIPKLPYTEAPPYLDGIAQEAMWSSAYKMELKDSWSGGLATTISMSRDEEYLYILSEVRESNPQRAAVSPKSRSRDLLTTNREQVRIRLDLDRDYCTWFELGWDRLGNRIDQCNDMNGWNPTWYIATQSTSEGWNAEIAIPLEELVSSAHPLSKSLHTLSWNAIHRIPSEGSRVLSPAVSDWFQNDQWTLVQWQR